MSLTHHTDRLFFIAERKAEIYQFEIPPETSEKVKKRQIFVGPHIQQRYERMALLPKTNGDDMLVVVFTGVNYIRRAGVEGGDTMEPIVLVTSEDNVGEWTETGVGVEDVYDVQNDQVHMLKQCVDGVDRCFKAWEAQGHEKPLQHVYDLLTSIA
jgi:hypothetical protein